MSLDYFFNYDLFVALFLSISNMLNILLATSVIGILAIGATFVISSAGLDLSIGSVMGFAGVAGAVTMNILELNWFLEF